MTMESAIKQRAHLSSLLEATVNGADGVAIGSICDIMLDTDSGHVCYVALAVGGILGVNEKLFAVPWRHFQIATGEKTVTLAFTKADFERLSGFNKDAWPTEADEFFC